MCPPPLYLKRAPLPGSRLFLLTLLVGAVTSVLYAVVLFHNPLVYFGVLMPFIWGNVLGLFGGWLYKRCRAGTRGEGLVYVFLASLPAFVLHWAVYYCLIMCKANGAGFFVMDGFDGLLPFLRNRAEMVVGALAGYKSTLSDLKNVNQEGTWEAFGIVFKGRLLLAVWGLEVLAFFGSVVHYFNKSVAKRGR